MKVKDLINEGSFKWINEAESDREIEKIYCCDLLSVVMGRAPANCAWVTVMGNVNAVAVATLAEMSVIILAENAVPDEFMLQRAKQEHVNVIKTELPIFDAAMIISNGL